MKKKFLWILLSCIMALTLVAWSCDGEEPGEEEEEEEGPSLDEPQYGGVYIVSRNTDISYFDEVVGGNYGGHVYAPTTKLTHNELLQGDWTKGPAGTNETTFINGGDNRMDQKTGCLADSWTIPEMGTIVFHIREGVKWQNKPPANGRLLTPEDVELSLKRSMTAGYFAYFYRTMAQTIEITRDDTERTITVTVPIDQWVNMLTLVPDYTSIVCPEVVDLYGGEADWRNVVGTGPFILTNYVSNSQVTMIRNPDYWETDPIGEGMGNQLPYVDTYKQIVIVDPSVREAAFRSGSLDVMSAINYNDAQPVATDPNLAGQIKFKTYVLDGGAGLFYRTDLPESPFSVKEVRQAIMLAIDQEAIRDQYWQGHAEINSWPVTPTVAYMDAYMPLEELPADVQALYGHDIEAAQALLEQTAYSEGFDCSVICWNTPAMIDVLSMAQEMLMDININMELDIHDFTDYNNRTRGRNHTAYEIMYTGGSGNGTYMKMIDFRGPGAYNPSYIDEDYSVAEIEAAYAEIVSYAGTDEAAMMAAHRALMPWLLEQAYCMPFPVPEYYVFWWPWVKNYSGEYAVGYYNYWGSAKYIWLDEELKDEMGF
ncbi:MAG: ABC transporter substrate-binding protein [Dehalococcoidales bacterium]|nr:MAG: ABC transporter substrate-binding protein [Dehalococcoidales bacterium]